MTSKAFPGCEEGDTVQINKDTKKKSQFDLDFRHVDF